MSARSAIVFRFKPNTSVGRQVTLFTEIFSRYGGGARAGASKNLDQSFYIPEGKSCDAIMAELKAIPEIDTDYLRFVSDELGE